MPWTYMSALFAPNGDWLGIADGTSLWVDQIRAGGRKIAAYSRDNNEYYLQHPNFSVPQPKTPIIWGTGPKTYCGTPGVSCGKRPVFHGSGSGRRFRRGMVILKGPRTGSTTTWPAGGSPPTCWRATSAIPSPSTG